MDVFLKKSGWVGFGLEKRSPPPELRELVDLTRPGVVGRKKPNNTVVNFCAWVQKIYDTPFILLSILLIILLIILGPCAKSS